MTATAKERVRILLPKTMEADIKDLSKHENKSISRIIVEALEDVYDLQLMDYNDK